MRVDVPVSVGELLDKITILRIKAQQIRCASKLANVRSELAALEAVRERELASSPELTLAFEALAEINFALWQVEDALREHESRADFSQRFIELARSVYRFNDQRAALKRRINELSGSSLIEEKSYAQTPSPP
jgi:hypothetical protein